MGNSFFAYLQQLELMAFFSGYPLLYAIILFFAGKKLSRNNFRNRVVSLLPFAYALTGTLYIGFQLKNLSVNYSAANVKYIFMQPWLLIWALLSLLFWLPALSKKKELSLIHSLVFFFFLVKDIVLQTSGSSGGGDILRNDMRIYTISFLLNLGALVLITLLSFMIGFIKKT
jgi:hypothetical protein